MWITLIGVLIGNTFEAAADLGGIAAALQLLMPWRFEWLATGVAAIIFGLQIWGSYQAIRNIFRVLTLALLAYIASAFLAHPHWGEVLRGTFVRTLKFDKDSLALLVAIIGTSLSAYLYTWQSNQEVEEQIAMGRTRLRDRKGATEAELRESRRDVLYGMIFECRDVFHHPVDRVDALRLRTPRGLERRGRRESPRSRHRDPGLDHHRGHFRHQPRLDCQLVPLMITGAGVEHEYIERGRVSSVSRPCCETGWHDGANDR